MNHRSRATSQTTIYPAYCFSASQTYNKWVKLTAVDVHALRQVKGFEGQNIYFHLNHPIRYAYVIGVVVALDFINGKFVIITLDDGSGATLDLKVTVIKQPEIKTAVTKQSSYSTARDVDTEKGEESGDESEHGQQKKNWYNRAEFQIHNSKHLVPVTRETETPNLTVTSVLGDFTLRLQGKEIDIGTVVKAKGTLHLFRNAFQLTLLRTFIVDSTEEEVAAWISYSEFATKVLAKPWVLSAEELKKLETADRERAEKEREDARKKIERSRRRKRKQKQYEERRRKHEERTERRTLKEAKELDGNPLDRKGWRPYVESENG